MKKKFLILMATVIAVGVLVTSSALYAYDTGVHKVKSVRVYSSGSVHVYLVNSINGEDFECTADSSKDYLKIQSTFAGRAQMQRVAELAMEFDSRVYVTYNSSCELTSIELGL